MTKQKYKPATFVVEGNNGGSFIRLEQVGKDRVALSVGHECVMAIDGVFDVVRLTEFFERHRDELIKG